jgi:uncharacterized protein (TIGR03382 family)
LSTDVGGSDCTCSGTGDYYCELDEVKCTSDSDCAGDLVCDEMFGQDDGGTTICVSSPDGGSECEVDAGSSSDTTQYCQPADLERWIGAAGHVYGGSAQDEASGGSNGGSSGGSNSDGRDVLSSEVDRGNGATSGGGGGQGSESAGCASTGLFGGSAGGALGFIVLAAFGVVGVRRRRNR